MPFKIKQKVHIRLDALEAAWYQFEAERGHLDSQSIEFTEHLELLKQSADALFKRFLILNLCFNFGIGECFRIFL